MPDWRNDVIRDLLDNGFTPRTGKGSHKVWSNGTKSTTVPTNVDRYMANGILKQAGINKRYN